MDKICILGSGGSLSEFKGTTGEIWAVGSLYHKVTADLFFCFHDFDKLPDSAAVIYAKDFPLELIIDNLGCQFFTCTISYMLAYAIYKEVKHIEIFGVDLDSDSEYEHQKASVDYWIGYARGVGITVDVHSDVDKTDFLYGFEPTKKLLQAMQNRKNLSIARMQTAKTEDEKNQWVGQIHDLEYWLRRLKQ